MALDKEGIRLNNVELANFFCIVGAKFCSIIEIYSLNVSDSNYS